MIKICSIEGCGKKAIARGWCGTHWARWRRHGDPNSVTWTPDGTPLQWIKEHVNYNGEDCLTWPFAKGAHGYGGITYNGTPTKPCRVMCLLAHGEPPTPIHDSSHTCGKGDEACVNPNHLLWETRAENIARTIEHGTKRRGERQYGNKLTEKQVLTIRSLYSRGGIMQKDLSLQFGVCRSVISEIVRRKAWGWLHDQPT